MVGLLWDAGDVTGAIALEGFWNALLGEVSFSLLCGYRASVLDSGADEPAARVCDADSASLSALPTLAAAETSRTFPPALTSAAKARGFLAHALAHWGADEQHCADAALIVSELATNAILHAKSAFAVSLGRVAGRVRVAVGDADPTLPRRPDLRVEAASGRGLLLVDAIAAKWGSTPANGGKLVWAELGA
jgi:anti-sigma regulatory factor (Ser/Thr protein kinase)